MTSGKVIGLSLFYLLYPFSAFGLSYWLPTILKGLGFGNIANGFLNMLPWLLVAASLLWWPRHADRVNERLYHIAIPTAFAALCLLGSVLLPSVTAKYLCLAGAAVGMYAGAPVFWSIPQTIFRGRDAAAAIAMISSFGNLGGFFAQSAVPFIRDATGNPFAPMTLLAGAMALASVLTFLVEPRTRVSIRQPTIHKKETSVSPTGAPR